MAHHLPYIIGARGGAAEYAPENTLESIHMATDMRLEMVHLNVKLTKDQVPVCFRDETLERVTGEDRKIAEMTLKEIQDIDAGSYLSESYTGVKAPTLEQALDVVMDNHLGLMVELTPCPGQEKNTAEAALDIMSQYWDFDGAPPLIAAEHTVSLETALDMANEWPRIMILNEDSPENWGELAKYLEVQALAFPELYFGKHKDILMAAELPLIAMDVTDEGTAAILTDHGVQTLHTSKPDMF